MAKDTATADLFEADGVTPVKVVEKPVITEAQLEAERRAARAEGEAAVLKTVVAAKPEKPVIAEKVYTRQELRALVNEGKLTEDDMDAVLERQLEAKMSKTVDEKINTKIGAADLKNGVTGKIAAYVEAFPAINEEGSDLRARITEEFRELISTGSPDTISTELAAIKAACGPLKAAGRRPKPDGHQDVGSGNGNGDRDDGDAGWAKGLSGAQKKHYQKMIDKGMYKNASDPKLVAELKFARKAH